jgi:serpin B
VDTAASAVARGANDFALRLSAGLVKNTGGENFVCSPYSVWMPLAALVNATDDQFKPALLTALGASGIDPADVNRASSRMLYDLTKLQNKDSKGYRNPLKIANAIFVGNDVTLRGDFAQTFMDYYRGSSINVDFSSRNAVDAVNRWASKNTNGLIKNVIQKFDPETVAALVNAIYFSDRWSWEFSKAGTKSDVFHSPAGDSTASFMIREGDRQSYYEDDSVQAVRLGYEEGGGMYIILPKAGGASEFLASMTAEYFNEIRSNYAPATGKLLLPRFSVENDIKGLKEALETLGVPLFDADDAPITGLIEENIPLYVSNVIQKALIKVDEEGTTAAAVTVIVMGLGSAGPGEPSTPFEMICDRPFVFILSEYTYDGGDQILFTGVVNRP